MRRDWPDALGNDIIIIRRTIIIIMNVTKITKIMPNIIITMHTIINIMNVTKVTMPSILFIMIVT